MNGAKTFVSVKAASAAIAFSRKINRRSALRHTSCGALFMMLAEAYGVRHQGYCRLGVVVMTVFLLGARRNGARSSCRSTSASMRNSAKVIGLRLPLFVRSVWCVRWFDENVKGVYGWIGGSIRVPRV